MGEETGLWMSALLSYSKLLNLFFFFFLSVFELIQLGLIKFCNIIMEKKKIPTAYIITLK